MATATRSITAPKASPSQPTPPLANGDRLSRAEFERRYTAAPQLKKAELIEGVVILPSPVSLIHSNLHATTMVWLGTYQVLTPGTDIGDNATLRLDLENEVQPDAFLRLVERVGGKSRATTDGYLEGAPEFIVEVAASSASYDLYDKLRVYQRNGVREYLVLLAHERETRWHVLIDDRYTRLDPDSNGILHSPNFPGLAFDSTSFWSGDHASMLQTLQTALASPVHQAFVDSLLAE